MKFQSVILSFYVLLSLTACKDKMVCAAYQSTYLLDDDRQTAKFSFFAGDSLILEASTAGLKKNIYGIKERDYSYWKQERLLVVDQKDVYSEEVDSLLNSKMLVPEERAEFDPNEVISSADSVNNNLNDSEDDEWTNTKRFQYNVDFVNYMLLVGNDVLKAQAEARDSAAANEEKAPQQLTDSTVNKSGGLRKKLFGGANKNKKDKSNKSATEEESAAAVEEKTKEEDN